MTADDCNEAVGISEYISRTAGFQGILKHRFSDFVVREVSVSGEATHLKSTEDLGGWESKYFKGKGDDAEVTSDNVHEKILEFWRDIGQIVQIGTNNDEHGDAAVTADVLSEPKSEALRSFILLACEKSTECPSDLLCFPGLHKAVRTAIHAAVKKHFSSYIETETTQVSDVSFIRLVATSRKQKGMKRKFGTPWPTGLGNYMRFTLLKENIDTMNAVNILNRALRCSNSNSGVSYSGTKDKRGVTAQKCTVYRRKPSDLSRINRSLLLPSILVGDFEYVDGPAMLGELGGNRFEIILRSLSAPSDLDVISACDSVRTHGFINYFGLQRFGKGGSKSHEIGREILKSNWEACVRMLFTSKSDDRVNIAQAKVLFNEQKYQLAIGLLPDQMHAEKGVLQCLQTHPADWLRAYQSIPKNARLICMHAYQSCLWNKAVSRRLSLHGLRCIEGDLVVTASTASSSGSVSSAQDNSFQRCSGHANAKSEVRVLTSEDLLSSQSHSIRDVVLPLLGSDSMLPTNAIGDYYLELLAADGLSMDVFRSCDAAYREKGAYRRMLQCPTDFVYKIIPYDDIDAELNETELTTFRTKTCAKLNKDNNTADASVDTSHAQPDEDDLPASGEGVEPTVPAAAASPSPSTREEDARHKALQLQFTLPPGTYGKLSYCSSSTNSALQPVCVYCTQQMHSISNCYFASSIATMLLRELTKESTESCFQAQLSKDAASSMDVAADALDMDDC